MAFNDKIFKLRWSNILWMIFGILFASMLIYFLNPEILNFNRPVRIVFEKLMRKLVQKNKKTFSFQCVFQKWLRNSATIPTRSTIGSLHTCDDRYWNFWKCSIGDLVARGCSRHLPYMEWSSRWQVCTGDQLSVWIGCHWKHSKYHWTRAWTRSVLSKKITIAEETDILLSL